MLKKTKHLYCHHITHMYMGPFKGSSPLCSSEVQCCQSGPLTARRLQSSVQLGH